MDGLFACPDCGGEIRLKGLSPGRLVRCGWCRTQVEVPYLPRAEQIKAMRRRRFPGRRFRLPTWAWSAATALTLAIVTAGAWRLVRSHRLKADRDVLAGLVEESRAAESSGRLGDSLAILEAAIARASANSPEPPGLGELRARRDAMSRREADAQLAALESAARSDDPGRAVGRALTLLARARKDEALAGLEPRVLTTLERLRLRWVEADAAAANDAYDAGRAAEALRLCQRQYTTAAELAPDPRTIWQGRANDLARQIIGRYGTIFDPVRGQFTLGSPPAYASLLGPAVTGALRTRGYLPRPADAMWEDYWSTLAPFRLSIDITERLDETYLESKNRVSTIEARVVLKNRGDSLWVALPISRTAVPLLGVPAYQAGRLGVGDRPNPESERLLYESALKNLVPQLGSALRRLPACPNAVSVDPASARGESARPPV